MRVSIGEVTGEVTPQVTAQVYYLSPLLKTGILEMPFPISHAAANKNIVLYQQPDGNKPLTTKDYSHRCVTIQEDEVRKDAPCV